MHGFCWRRGWKLLLYHIEVYKVAHGRRFNLQISYTMRKVDVYKPNAREFLLPPFVGTPNVFPFQAWAVVPTALSEVDAARLVAKCSACKRGEDEPLRLLQLGEVNPSKAVSTRRDACLL